MEILKKELQESDEYEKESIYAEIEKRNIALDNAIDQLINM